MKIIIFDDFGNENDVRLGTASELIYPDGHASPIISPS